MGVEGGLKCVKYLVVFCNFIFSLCGLALIVVGVLVQLKIHDQLMIKDAAASGAPILLIVLGVIVFLIAFFGCCGAWKENFCMVTAFAIFLSLIIIAEIAAVIVGCLYRGKVKELVQDSLLDMISKYNTGSPAFKTTVDHLQQELKCCGANSSSDWKTHSTKNNTVPDSCCIKESKGCGQGAMTDPSKVYQTGCQVVVENLLEENLKWVIIAAVVIAILQVLGLVFAGLLMRGIRSGYEVM